MVNKEYSNHIHEYVKNDKSTCMKNIGWVHTAPHNSDSIELTLNNLSATFCIGNTFHWSLSCHSQQVEPSRCPQHYALALSLSSVTLLENALTWISCLSVCVGNADQKFSAVADARNCQFLNSSGKFNTHISEHSCILGASIHVALLNTNCQEISINGHDYNLMELG